MMPNGWNIATLGDHITIKSGYSPSKYNLSVSGAYPFVKVEDMNNCTKHQFLSRAYTEVNGQPVPKGAVIFPKRGAAIMNNKVRITGNDMYLDTNMMALIPKGSVCSEYLYYTLVREELHRIADTSTIPQINNKHITPYRFNLPPLPEQHKIATILSTWDKAISTTERLIDSSRQQKKSLMQQLLRGKKRLLDDSGKMFEAEWEKVKLEDLSTKISDGIHSTPKYADVSQVRFVNGNNLKNGKIVFQKSTKYVDEENAMKHRRNLSNRTLLMSINGTIGNLATYNGENIVLGKSSCYMNIKQGIDLRFVFFKLASSTIQSYFISELTGSTIKNLSLKTIKTTRFELPSYEEQQKIATVLTNADKEIELLEQQLTDLKQEKKALMQQLLTGKRRVTI